MTEVQKKKSKEVVHKLHDKYYGNKSKAKAPSIQDAGPAKPDAIGKCLSRNELMLEAKARGVKNFRVINKEELIEILKEGTAQERINEIMAGAVARWKAGWGKHKKTQK